MTHEDLALLHRKLVLIQGLAHRIATRVPSLMGSIDDAELIVTEVDEIIDLLAVQPKETA